MTVLDLVRWTRPLSTRTGSSRQLPPNARTLYGRATDQDIFPPSSFIPVRPASAASYPNISTWHDLDEVSGTHTVGHGRVVEQRRVVVGEHLVDRVTGGVEPEVLMCLDQGGS